MNALTESVNLRRWLAPGGLRGMSGNVTGALAEFFVPALNTNPPSSDPLMLQIQGAIPFDPDELLDEYLTFLTTVSDTGSIRDTIHISAATYYESHETEIIHFQTLSGSGFKNETLLLASTPPARKPTVPEPSRSSVPSMLVRLGTDKLFNDRMRSPLRMSAAAHFYSTPQEQVDRHIAKASPSDQITYPNPLPLEEVIILVAGLNSHKRRTYSNTQDSVRPRFAKAVWAGMKYLSHIKNTSRSLNEGNNDGDKDALDPAIMDNFKEHFGQDLLKFHSKLIQLQQSSDSLLNARKSKVDSIQEDIARRKRNIADGLRASEQLAQANKEIAERAEMMEAELKRISAVTASSSN